MLFCFLKETFAHPGCAACAVDDKRSPFLKVGIDLFPEGFVRFPEGIDVIREVTGEKEFTNPWIARIRKSE